MVLEWNKWFQMQHPVQEHPEIFTTFNKIQLLTLTKNSSWNVKLLNSGILNNFNFLSLNYVILKLYFIYIFNGKESRLNCLKSLNWFSDLSQPETSFPKFFQLNFWKFAFLHNFAQQMRRTSAAYLNGTIWWYEEIFRLAIFTHEYLLYARHSEYIYVYTELKMRMPPLTPTSYDFSFDY